MLPMSLDCLSSSCVLSVQCCRCLWIVCLRPVSCVSNVANVSGLFVFFLCLVCPMLPMFLDCLSSSCVLCVQCCQSLWIVCLRPVSCGSNAADVSGLFVFVLFLVCPILPISLDCLSSSCVLCVQYWRCLWIVCFRPVSCVSNAADVSGLFVFVLCLVCPIRRCLWIVCLRPVSCVSNTADVSGLFIFVLCLVCPILPMSLDCLSSSCVLCVQYCRCLWIVCLRPVSCVSNTANVSGLFVFVLCLVCPILAMSLDCLSSSFVLCVQYCRCLWIVCLRPVSCVSNTGDVSRLFVFVLCLVCPMLPMSLNCLSSSCVLCVHSCRCL